MRIVLGLPFLLAALLVAPGAHAARTAPLQNYDDVLVATSDGKPVTAEQVRNAIIAGASRARWTASVGQGNTVRLTYNKSSHTAVVDVMYSVKSYSIRYADSTDLNYGQEGGSAVIHPNYNKWISKLKQSIDKSLRNVKQ
jgi:hypothetical protein